MVIKCFPKGKNTCCLLKSHNSNSFHKMSQYDFVAMEDIVTNYQKPIDIDNLFCKGRHLYKLFDKKQKSSFLIAGYIDEVKVFVHQDSNLSFVKLLAGDFSSTNYYVLCNNGLFHQQSFFKKTFKG